MVLALAAAAEATGWFAKPRRRVQSLATRIRKIGHPPKA